MDESYENLGKREATANPEKETAVKNIDGSELIKAHIDSEYAGSFVTTTVEGENRLKIVLPMAMPGFSELVLDLATRFEAVCELSHADEGGGALLTVWHSFRPEEALDHKPPMIHPGVVFVGVMILALLASYLHGM